MDYINDNEIKINPVHNLSLSINDLTNNLNIINFDEYLYHQTHFEKKILYETEYIYFKENCFDIGMGICDFNDLDHLDFFVDKNLNSGKKLLNFINDFENKLNKLKNHFIIDFNDKYEIKSIINNANLNVIDDEINKIKNVEHNDIFNFINFNNCPGIEIVNNDNNNKGNTYGFGKKNKNKNENEIINDIIDKYKPQVSKKNILDCIKLGLKKINNYYYRGKIIYNKNKNIIKNSINNILLYNIGSSEEDINNKINELIFKMEFYDNLNKTINYELVKMKDVVSKKSFMIKINYKKMLDEIDEENFDPNNLNADNVKNFFGETKNVIVYDYKHLKKYFKSRCYMKIYLEFEQVQIDKYNDDVEKLYFKLNPIINQIDIIELNEKTENRFKDITYLDYQTKINNEMKNLKEKMSKYIYNIKKSNLNFEDDNDYNNDIDYLYQDSTLTNISSTNNYDFDLDSEYENDFDLKNNNVNNENYINDYLNEDFLVIEY